MTSFCLTVSIYFAVFFQLGGAVAAQNADLSSAVCVMYHRFYSACSFSVLTTDAQHVTPLMNAVWCFGAEL